MYYLKTRYYNPENERFLNEDIYVSTGRGLLDSNMFAYCRNNPTCRKDSSGTTEVAGPDDKPELVDDDKTIAGGKMGKSGSRGFVSKNAKYNFKSKLALNDHYEKHNSEFGNAFSDPQAYVDAANYVIQNGEYVAPQNGYVKFYGMNGRANYAFVGMSFDHTYITTFHLKHVSQIQFAVCK